MKIVVAEKIAPAAIALLREEPGWNVVAHEQIKDLAVEVADADALIVRSAVQADAPLLAHARKLKVVGRAGVGVDNIDLEAATKQGIAVMNTPGGNAVAVAEHTIALMLALARHIPRAASTTAAGKWEKKSLQGSELRGKVLGIVGLGRIGVEVARRAAGFQMSIVAHDPFVTPTLARELGIQLCTLDEIYAAADYISLHLGLTPQTAGMIGEAAIAKMKPGVRIINCARGELVDDAALAAALLTGKVGGAALDVFTVEPPKDSPLLGLPNVIATPHIAGSTAEAQDAVGVQIAQQIREYLQRGVIQNAVNVPSLSDEEYQEIAPYMSLAEKLGAFVAQITAGNVVQIQVRYSGRVAEMKTALIRNAAIQGLLNQHAADKANVVNAATVAAERGIQVTESRKPETKGGAGNVLRLTVHTTEHERAVTGAVLHGNMPRLLAIDDIEIEVPLSGHLLYLRNRDVPGVVGRVGTLLGDNAVNIANFSLGRADRTGEQGSRDAVAVVQVDSPVPDAVLARLREIPAIAAAASVRLA